MIHIHIFTRLSGIHHPYKKPPQKFWLYVKRMPSSLKMIQNVKSKTVKVTIGILNKLISLEQRSCHMNNDEFQSIQIYFNSTASYLA